MRRSASRAATTSGTTARAGSAPSVRGCCARDAVSRIEAVATTCGSALATPATVRPTPVVAPRCREAATDGAPRLGRRAELSGNTAREPIPALFRQDRRLGPAARPRGSSYARFHLACDS
jgi:hypothetical protein